VRGCEGVGPVRGRHFSLFFFCVHDLVKYDHASSTSTK
jgi:hypothetical protein